MMESEVETMGLADPVCGKPVAFASPHRHVHCGALFCFCSDGCRARFAAHPSRLAFLALSGGVRPGRAQGVDAPESPPPAAPPTTRPTTSPPLTRSDDPRPARSDGRFRVLRGWHERRLATRCCRRLLTLYNSSAAEKPELAGDGLYREVVALHQHCDTWTAQDMLEEARASYASWPANRELRFRDVAHYLAVSEIFRAYSDSPWAQAEIRRVVDAAIPSDL
jgi:YHS domain-containing protein